MPFAEILLLALGLAMDAAAVALARGCSASTLTLRTVALVALFFGGFQSLMPLLGFVLGALLGPFLQSMSHWLAFVMIGGIGAKMLWEGLHSEADDVAGDPARMFSLGTLLVLAIATSIDALAAGITLPLLGAPLALSVTTIGVVTAALSAVALCLGRAFAGWLRARQVGHRLDAVGGVVLIALGLKILLQGLAP